MGGAIALAYANAGAKVAWVVPTYKNGRPLWRWAEGTVAPLGKRVQVAKSERVITFPTRGFLGIYSADNPTAMRGESFHLVIVDEAARVAEEVWTDVLQPTLADFGGRSILISTPMGRNWFYQEWQRGRVPNSEIKAWTAPTSANPNPRIQRAARLARERVSASTYRQEWLAEFVEDGLTLFRLADIDRAEVGAVGTAARLAARRYLTTVDVGRRQDATVINTFDASQMPYQRVAFERLERVSFPIIQRAIDNRTRAYPGETVVESNGIGDPTIENLEMPVTPFYTSPRSKMQALEALQWLFERGHIKAKWDARERAALARAAWDDDHTADEVMSLAIAASVLRHGAGWNTDALKPLSSGRRV